jgi:hypothetical protein
MKLDWPHVVIFGLLLAFVVGLALLALHAGESAAPLWAIVATSGGALVTAGVALFRGASLTGQLARMRDNDARERDTLPPGGGLQ